MLILIPTLSLNLRYLASGHHSEYERADHIWDSNDFSLSSRCCSSRRMVGANSAARVGKGRSSPYGTRAIIISMPYPASYFRLSMFRQCRQRYKLHYVDGLAQEYRKPRPYLMIGEVAS